MDNAKQLRYMYDLLLNSVEKLEELYDDMGMQIRIQNRMTKILDEIIHYQKFGRHEEAEKFFKATLIKWQLSKDNELLLTAQIFKNIVMQGTMVTFDKGKLSDLKIAYNNAVEKEKETFKFENEEYLVSYAKYLIEYLTNKLK